MNHWQAMCSLKVKKKSCLRHPGKSKKGSGLKSPLADKRVIELYRQKISEKLNNKKNAKKAAMIISEMIKQKKKK